MDRRLDIAKRGDAQGIVGAAAVRAARGVDTAETRRVVVIGRPTPDIGRGSRGVVLILHLAISCFVVRELSLVILLCAIGIRPGTVYLKLCGEIKLLRGGRDVARGILSAADIV